MDFIKKLKPFDWLVIVIVIACFVVGFLTFAGKRATSSKNIEKTANIDFAVYLRGVSTIAKEPLFKENEETFITIRNVPYTKLKIKSIEKSKRKIVIPAQNYKKYIVVDDESSPYTYDYLVTLSDSATITKDNDAVVGGNKVKIGIPITLEGPKYKLNGVIVDVTVAD